MSNVEIYGKWLEKRKSAICSDSAHKEIHALTKSIIQLYEILPLILNNNNNNSNTLSNLIFEDTTSLFPECSVKYKEVGKY